MEEPIEELYFDWLCDQVIPTDTTNYRDLLRILYSTEFVYEISGDENRAADGVELREDFSIEFGIKLPSSFNKIGCSIFEMLWALAKRAEFQTSNTAREWFWEFITNLYLGEFRRLPEDGSRAINEILNDFVWRRYLPNGDGGLFPIRWPKDDQRQIQLWDQFFEYIEDQGRY